MWEYAKLVATSATGRERRGAPDAAPAADEFWRLATHTYTRLLDGELRPSTLVRENKLLVDRGEECAYCGRKEELQWEHVIPLACGGPDTIDNLVRACRTCNQEKGGRDPLQWYGAARRDKIPRLVMGKLLKLLLQAHEDAGSLHDAEYPPGAGLRLAQLTEVFRARR